MTEVKRPRGRPRKDPNIDPLVAAAQKLKKLRTQMAALVVETNFQLARVREKTCAAETGAIERLKNEGSFSEDDLLLFEQLPVFLRTYRDAMREDPRWTGHVDMAIDQRLVKEALPTTTLKALSLAGDTVPDQSSRALIDEGSISVGRIAQFEKGVFEAKRTDKRLWLDNRILLIDQAIQRSGSTRFTKFAEDAEQLAKAIVAFQNEFFSPAPPLTEEERESSRFEHYTIDMQTELLGRIIETPERDAAHARIVEMAADLLPRFGEFFTENHPEAGDWLEVGLSNPHAARLAQAQYALRILAMGKFGASGFGPFGPIEYQSSFLSNAIDYLAGGLALAPEQRNRRHAPRPIKKLKALEICSGIGGIGIGLVSAGFKPVAMVEVDQVAVRTLRKNWPDWNVLQADLKSSDTKATLARFKGEIDLLAGGLPCQPFSQAGKRKGENDPRNLYDEGVELVGLLEPTGFFFENVSGFEQDQFADYQQRVLESFKRLGYSVWAFNMRANHYGLAQRRTRWIIVGLRGPAARRFEIPNLRNPYRRQLRHLKSVLFPHISPPGNKSPSTAQKLYDDWAAEWLRVYGRRTAATVIGRMDQARPEIKQQWVKLGFDLKEIAANPIEIGQVTDTAMLMPLSLPLLMSLQGFPREWKLPEVDAKSASQLIANAFPPAVARAVAQAIHNAIVPEEFVDLDRLTRTPVINAGMIGRKTPPPKFLDAVLNMHRYPDDPVKERLKQYQRYLSYYNSEDDSEPPEVDYPDSIF
ncbi:DNA cytosine methyltransferase [Rhizobium sp. BR 315]|uniref:DNA cytosine methyltransferase n=1 Tax=Rhizobium sp. BR 315 TaxID=3040014 RepID=UPI003D34151B